MSGIKMLNLKVKLNALIVFHLGQADWPVARGGSRGLIEPNKGEEKRRKKERRERKGRERGREIEAKRKKG